MISKILVATDFSENSKRALDIAVDLAEKLNASLTILNVFQTPHPPVTFSGEMPIEQPDPLLYRRAEEIKRISDQEITKIIYKIKEFKPHISLLSLVKEGDPISEIVDATKNFHLVVVGHKGLSRLREAFMGTTSERIVHLAKCPVLVVQ